MKRLKYEVLTKDHPLLEKKTLEGIPRNLILKKSTVWHFNYRKGKIEAVKTNGLVVKKSPYNYGSSIIAFNKGTKYQIDHFCTTKAVALRRVIRNYTRQLLWHEKQSSKARQEIAKFKYLLKSV